jgi:hypothetical protein
LGMKGKFERAVWDLPIVIDLRFDPNNPFIHYN